MSVSFVFDDIYIHFISFKIFHRDDVIIDIYNHNWTIMLDVSNTLLTFRRRRLLSVSVDVNMQWDQCNDIDVRILSRVQIKLCVTVGQDIFAEWDRKVDN